MFKLFFSQKLKFISKAFYESLLFKTCTILNISLKIKTMQQKLILKLTKQSLKQNFQI